MLKYEGWKEQLRQIVRDNAVSENGKRVSIRDIDRPISEYPKGTVFVQDHDDIVIPIPTKEQIERHKQNHQNQDS